MAANWANLDNQTRTMMKSAQFLLASQRVPKAQSTALKTWTIGKAKEPVSEEYEAEWVLCKASDVSSVANLFAHAKLTRSGRTCRQPYNGPILR